MDCRCLPKSCCCCDLRIGSLLIIVITCFISISAAGFFAYIIYRLHSADGRETTLQTYETFAYNITSDTHEVLAKTMPYVYVGVFLLWLVSCFVSFAGFAKMKRSYHLFWLIMTPLAILAILSIFYGFLRNSTVLAVQIVLPIISVALIIMMVYVSAYFNDFYDIEDERHNRKMLNYRINKYTKDPQNQIDPRTLDSVKPPPLVYNSSHRPDRRPVRSRPDNGPSGFDDDPYGRRHQRSRNDGRHRDEYNGYRRQRYGERGEREYPSGTGYHAADRRQWNAEEHDLYVPSSPRDDLSLPYGYYPYRV